MQKEEDNKALHEKIYQLEKEHDRYILNAVNIKDSP
jgi:hypothetical protein